MLKRLGFALGIAVAIWGWRVTGFAHEQQQVLRTGDNARLRLWRGERGKLGQKFIVTRR